ncbi:hypothetical protein C8Q80DRAFT_1070812, partial [Daedaleopsis nitida]
TLACPIPDSPKTTCQTSGGSPSTSDCNEAINQLSGIQCTQSNQDLYGSYCKTLVQVGTCKIDVCGYPGSQLDDGVDCHKYLRTLYNTCQSGGRVGGFTQPSPCYVDWTHVP